MPGPKSAIPVGTQFSPDLVHLPSFLRAIAQYSGDKPAMERAVWQPPARVAPVKASPTRRRASLPLEAARQYGLLDEGYRTTDLAQKLLSLPEPDVYEEFARHILQFRGGLRVTEAAQQMAVDETASNIRITGDTLAVYLTNQGFNVTEHNTAINSLRLWLEKAGVFLAGTWKVDPLVKARLLGLDDDQIAALASFTAEQREFLLALCRIDPKGPFPASTVRENAERSLGRRLDRSSLPKLMHPLKVAGFIDYSSGGTASGKTARVWTTSSFRKDVLEPFLERAMGQLDTALAEYYRRDFTDLVKELDSTDTYVKGVALEAFAIQIMRRLGLRFVRWRVRSGDRAGGAEVDAVMSGVVGGSPTRWQVQCKNTPKSEVSLDQVAKEVGLLPLTKATHILMLARCPFTPDAEKFAQDIMRHSSVSIFLLNGRDFDELRTTSGGALARILHAKAVEIASLKRPGLDWLG